MAFGLAVVATTACGGANKEAEEICQRAADRYTQCVGEVLGDEAKRIVSAPEKDGRAQCAADDRTVQAYKKCLPMATCDEFMNCTMDIAMATP